MNWKRGFWRIWVVATISWLAVSGLIAFDQWPTGRQISDIAFHLTEAERATISVGKNETALDRLKLTVRYLDGNLPPEIQLKLEAIDSSLLLDARRTWAIEYTGVILGPPIAVLLAVWIGLWVARGFWQKLSS